MREVVKAKFEQNENLKKLLLATGTSFLEERTRWNDTVWGTNLSGIGENRLGIILMEVRASLAHPQPSAEL